MKKIIKALGVLLILTGLFVAYILNSAGAFRSITPHFNGTEEVIQSPAGIEDITIDQSSGQVYLSAHNRREFNQPGAIYTFNANDSSSSFIDLTGQIDDDQFRPHGISLLKKYGRTFLFAISHNDEANYVYRFEILKDSIINSTKFTNDLFISPNDLVALDTTTFFFTNDHGMKKGLERSIKDFVMDKNGFVVLYKDGKSTKVSQKMAYPNGINISPDGKYLYVSTTTESTLYVYKNDTNGPLELLDSKKAYTGLDNIEIDLDGNLIIGSHPQMLKFLGHAKSKEKRSPSQIMKFIYLPETEHKFLQEELYLNDGDPLSGSSVGAYYQKKDGSNSLYVGSVYEDKILRLERSF